MLEGATAFASSLGRGFRGLFEKPLQGAQQGGLEGAWRGGDSVGQGGALELGGGEDAAVPLASLSTLPRLLPHLCAGAIKGVGKGLLGAVANPVSGWLDAMRCGRGRWGGRRGIWWRPHHAPPALPRALRSLGPA